MTVAVLLLLPTAALARSKVTLTLPDADAGAPVHYSYTASHIPSRAQLVLQRQIGTARQFKTVAVLARSHGGSGSLPALDLGRYRLRVAVTERKRVRRSLRTVILAQQQTVLTVYGTITFSILFKRDEQTYITPTRSFSYVFSTSYVSNSENLVTVDSKVNTCRSVHVDWVFRNTFSDQSGDTGVASLVQESRDPVTSTASANDITGLDAVVTPGRSWGLNVTPQGNHDLDFYVNGTANCSTRSLV